MGLTQPQQLLALRLDLELMSQSAPAAAAPGMPPAAQRFPGQLYMPAGVHMAQAGRHSLASPVGPPAVASEEDVDALLELLMT